MKALDFSRVSSRHKDELWREMLRQSEVRHLTDDELDAVAGGGKPMEDGSCENPQL